MKKLLLLAVLAVVSIKAETDAAKKAQEEMQTITRTMAEEQRLAIQKRGEQNWYKSESILEFALAAALANLIYLSQLGQPASSSQRTVTEKLLLVYKWALIALTSGTSVWVVWKLIRDFSDESCLNDKISKLTDEYNFLKRTAEYSGRLTDPAAEAGKSGKIEL